MEHTSARSYYTGAIPFALGAFLVGIVGGFTSVLGPAFVQDMGLDYNNTAWTALAMAISSAAGAPILGRWGDRIGHRRMLFLGILIFTCGNVLTALAPSLTVMLVARFIVGVGSAAIAPVVMSYIVTEFPPDRQGQGFALYMLISSCAVIFGPTCGGLLIAAYGWRAMMWVCVALSFFVLVLCYLLPGAPTVVRRPAQVASPAPFDYAGAVCVFLFFGALLCLPTIGQNIGWGTPAFSFAFLVALLFLFLLWLAENRAAAPILPGAFIRRRRFLLAILVLFFTQGSMQANMTNMIVFVQYTQGGNSVISGYAISFLYIGMSLGAVLLGPLADRHEPKHILLFSLLLTGMGCGLMLFFTPQASAWLMVLSLGVLGLGLGGNGTLCMRVALSGLATAASSAATGTYGLFRDLAAPLGVAIFVPLFTNRITAGVQAGDAPAMAAVAAIRELGVIELCCVLAGVVCVLFLPKIYEEKKEGTAYEITG